MENIISCDWLSFTGHLIYKNDCGFYPINNGKYSTSNETKGTAVYKTVQKYSKNNTLYYTVLYNPRAAFLSDYSCQVKLANEILYSSELEEVLNDIFECGITFHCITRLDLCIDYLKFDTNMTPNKFIELVMKNKIFKLRKGDGFTFYKSHHNIEFTGISFGKKSSICHWRLYNKSLELREVKDKHYIRQLWANNGYSEEQGDVWRLEVELKDISTIQLSYNNRTNVFDNVFDIITGVHYYFIFNYFLERTFRFKYKDNNKNISRCKDVMFFNHQPNIYRRYTINGFNRNNRQKSTISGLVELIGNRYLQQCDEIDKVIDTLIILTKQFELEYYLEEKYNIDIDLLEKYKFDILEPEKRYYYECI